MSPSPIPHIHVAETGSTNADAMARALAGAPLPFWLSADRQSAGKGRAGRVWQSGDGNLQASLALPLTCPPATAAQLALVAGVAAIGALAAVSPVQAAQLRLKWPNDIMNDHAKLGGILIETASRGPSGGLIAVIGIGLNVASAPTLPGRATTSFAALGSPASPRSIHPALLEAMDAALALWDEGRGFGEVRQRWLASALPTGTGLSVHAGGAIVHGTFAGLDYDGALLLNDPGGRVQRFTFGDVRLAGDR